MAFNGPSQDATLSYAVSVGRDMAETTVAPIVNDDQATYAIQLDGAEYYHRAQEVAAENVPVIYTTLSERLSAVRNVFANLTPTLYALFDIRYVHRTDH